MRGRQGKRKERREERKGKEERERETKKKIIARLRKEDLKFKASLGYMVIVSLTPHPPHTQCHYRALNL